MSEFLRSKKGVRIAVIEGKLLTSFQEVVLNDYFGIVLVRKTSHMPDKCLAVNEGCEQYAEFHCVVAVCTC